MDDKRIPSRHLEGKFKVVGVLPGEVIWRGSKVDLRSITLEDAEKIHGEGFPYLQRELKIREKKQQTPRNQASTESDSGKTGTEEQQS